jgi:hypothetical protein
MHMQEINFQLHLASAGGRKGNGNRALIAMK